MLLKWAGIRGRGTDTATQGNMRSAPTVSGYWPWQVDYWRLLLVTGDQPDTVYGAVFGDGGALGTTTYCAQ